MAQTKQKIEIDKRNLNIGESFLLKEYEKIYDLYKIHYDSSERVFKMYFVIVGVFFSLLTYIYSNNFEGIVIFKLNSLAVFFLCVISIIGVMLYFMLIEHKIKTILYVRSINAIRKSFVDADPGLDQYLILPKDRNVPKYFSVGKGFFWEALTFAFMSSIFISLTIMNLINYLTPVKYNLLFFALIALIIAYLHILFYYYRGKQKIISGDKK